MSKHVPSVRLVETTTSSVSTCQDWKLSLKVRWSSVFKSTLVSPSLHSAVLSMCQVILGLLMAGAQSQFSTISQPPEYLSSHSMSRAIRLALKWQTRSTSTLSSVTIRSAVSSGRTVESMVAQNHQLATTMTYSLNKFLLTCCLQKRQKSTVKNQSFGCEIAIRWLLLKALILNLLNRPFYSKQLFSCLNFLTE